VVPFFFLPGRAPHLQRVINDSAVQRSGRRGDNRHVAPLRYSIHATAEKSIVLARFPRQEETGRRVFVAFRFQREALRAPVFILPQPIALPTCHQPQQSCFYITASTPTPSRCSSPFVAGFARRFCHGNGFFLWQLGLGPSRVRIFCVKGTRRRNAEQLAQPTSRAQPRFGRRFHAGFPVNQQLSFRLKNFSAPNFGRRASALLLFEMLHPAGACAQPAAGTWHAGGQTTKQKNPPPLFKPFSLSWSSCREPLLGMAEPTADSVRGRASSPRADIPYGFRLRISGEPLWKGI